MAEPPEPGPGTDETKALPGAVRGSTPPASAGEGAYAPGDVINARYRVVRRLGRGGMGEVYEVEDFLLREKAALKTIRPQVADDEEVIKRFIREIQLARKVTHPNACRIFEVGSAEHKNAQRAYLTMELLDGETLAARLGKGRMTPAEALPIVQQIAGALAAAHAAGIVHRDLKTANVILVGPRAVVTDFGLARVIEEGMDPSLTGEGAVVGSPAYMAPEQVEGGRLSETTDVYSLGVVMFEMVTGRVPFVGETAMATALMRVREPAPPARTFVPGLDERWDRVIARCLERDPQARFPSAREVVVALGGTRADRAPAARSRRWLAPAGAAALAAIGIGAAVMLTKHASPAPPPAAIDDVRGHRPSAAVFAFKNLSGKPELDFLSTAIGEVLATELATGERIRTVAAESVARAKRDLALADADGYARDTLARLRSLLDADYVIVGSFVATGPGGDKLRVDLKLQDTRTGETVITVTETGTQADFTDMVVRAGTKLRGQLAAGALSPSEQANVRASIPARADVAKLYLEGLADLRVNAAAAARGLLEEAVAADPSFAAAHTALADALSDLGFETRALEEGQRGVDLAHDLAPETRHAAEAKLLELKHEHKEATEAYAKLFAEFPDDVDYGVELATLQIYAGDHDAAGRTIAALRQLPPPAGDSTAIDLLEVDNQIQHETHEGVDVVTKQRHDLAVRYEPVRLKAAARGERLLESKILRQQAALNIFGAGKAEDGVADARAARKICQAAADRDCVLETLMEEAWVDATGKLDELAKLHEQALALADVLDSTRAFGGFEYMVGAALEQAGEYHAAANIFDEYATWAHSRGKIDDEATALSMQSLTMLTLGDLIDADGMVKRAMALAPSNPMAKALVAMARSFVALYRGDLAVVRANDDEIAKVLPKNGLAIFYALPRIMADLEDEHFAAAEDRARQMAAEVPRPEYGATLLLARVLLAEGKLDEARVLLDEKFPIITPVVKYEREHLIAELAVRSASTPADRTTAEQRYQAALAGADASGYLVFALDDQVDLGRAQLRFGETAAGRATLMAAEKRATDKGLYLFAHRARRILDANH